MKPEEAIEGLRLINLSRVHPFYDWKEMAEVRDMAIEAIKEVQQYREIGTVKECRELASIVNKVERNELAKTIDEWISYRKIGTVEECREVVERLPKAEEVIRRLLCSDYNSSCSFCEHFKNKDAECCNIGGGRSWCYENARWNGKESEEE